MNEHYFVFSTDWLGHDRLCGYCGLTYDAGSHIEITDLKPYTSYVCSSGGGYGHSSRYTGAYHPVNRRIRDRFCVCGLELVVEDRERWLLSWQMERADGEWRTVDKVQSKHAAVLQKAGLEELIEQGEPIRNVRLVQIQEAQA